MITLKQKSKAELPTNRKFLTYSLTVAGLNTLWFLALILFIILSGHLNEHFAQVLITMPLLVITSFGVVYLLLYLVRTAVISRENVAVSSAFFFFASMFAAFAGFLLMSPFQILPNFFNLTNGGLGVYLFSVLLPEIVALLFILCVFLVVRHFIKNPKRLFIIIIIILALFAVANGIMYSDDFRLSVSSYAENSRTAENVKYLAEYTQAQVAEAIKQDTMTQCYSWECEVAYAFEKKDVRVCFNVGNQYGNGAITRCVVNYAIAENDIHVCNEILNSGHPKLDYKQCLILFAAVQNESSIKDVESRCALLPKNSYYYNQCVLDFIFVSEEDKSACGLLVKDAHDYVECQSLFETPK